MAIGRLDLRDKLYQRSIWDKVSAVAHGASTDAPVIVDLDPTTFCDLACPECISGKLLNKSRFTPERLLALAEELVEAGVQGVILIGGGEPLAHKGTRDAIAALGEAGVAIGLVTNGTMIDRYLDEIAAYVTWCRVSVDAATDNTYRLFRPDRGGNSKFGKVTKNIRALAEVKRGDLGYSFLVMSRTDDEGRVVATNAGEVFRAGALAKELGCDFFEVKCMFDEGHYLIDQPPKVVEQLNQELAQLQTLEDDRFEVVYSSTAEAVVVEGAPAQAKAYSTCPMTELRTLITPSGVYPCPYHRGEERLKLGDVVDMSFREMWERADRKRVDPRRDCGFHCARHASNEAIVEIGHGVVKKEITETRDVFI
jgi:MoaA/NifB/PqqE/SkfB family radical SAM enzyme